MLWHFLLYNRERKNKMYVQLQFNNDFSDLCLFHVKVQKIFTLKMYGIITSIIFVLYIINEYFKKTDYFNHPHEFLT